MYTQPNSSHTARGVLKRPLARGAIVALVTALAGLGYVNPTATADPPHQDHPPTVAPRPPDPQRSKVHRGALHRPAAAVDAADGPPAAPNDAVGPPSASEVARADDLLTTRYSYAASVPRASSWSQFSADQTNTTSTGPEGQGAGRALLRAPYATHAFRPFDPTFDRAVDARLTEAGENSLLVVGSADDLADAANWHARDVPGARPQAGGTYVLTGYPGAGLPISILTAQTAGDFGATAVGRPTGNDQSQQWSFVDAGGGYYRIINRADGLCLNALGASTDSGSSVGTFYCEGGQSTDAANLWRFVSPNGLLGQLQNKASGLFLTPTGNNLIIQTSQPSQNPSPNQLWSLAQINQPGGVVPTWSVPNNGKLTEPAALATGDLDRQAGADNQYHDEAVTAYAESDRHLTVRVLDYNANASHLLETGWSDASITVGDDSGFYPGSVGVAVGDFDGDDLNEIAVTWQDSNISGVFRVQLLKYAASGPDRSLTPVGTPQNLMNIGSNGWESNILRGSGSSSTTAADVNGDGRSELVVGYGADSGDFRTQAWVTVASFANTGRLSFTGDHLLPVDDEQGEGPASIDWTTRGVQVVPALLRYDPANGYSLHRRQLAITYSNWRDTTHTMTTILTRVDVSSQNKVYSFTDIGSGNSDEIIESTSVPPKTMALQGSPMSITAGGFSGPGAGADAPLWGVALGYTSYAVFPHGAVTVYRPNADGILKATYGRSGTITEGPSTVTAYDRSGRSLLLGAPVVVSVDAVSKPSVIGAQPPTHVDWLNGSFVNVSRTGDVTVELGQGGSTDLKGSHTSKAATTVGVSQSFDAESSLEAGLFGLEKVGASADLSQKFSKDWDTENADYSNWSSTMTWADTQKTTDDDIVDVFATTYTIYRYPILGTPPLTGNADVGCTTCHPFYEVTLPGAKTLIQGAGRDFPFYQPPWQNGNALSYPPLAAGQVPINDLGSYSYTDENGDTQTETQSLYQGTHNVSGTDQTSRLDFSSKAGSGHDRTSGGGMDNGVDSKTTVSAEENLGIEKGEVKASVGISFDDKQTWSTTDTSDSTVDTDTSFALDLPQITASQGYQIGSTYYVSSAAVQKVVHGVDLTAVRSGSTWWQQHYGLQSDLALNLPDAITMTYNEVTKHYDIPKWTSDSSRQLIRGFQVVHPGAAGDPTAGDPYTINGNSTVPTDAPVQFSVQVHNYSLKGSAQAPAHFWAVPVSGNEVSGQAIDLGDVTVPALGPQDMTTIYSPVWSAKGPGTVGVQDWRIFVQLDPGGTIPEIHPLNGGSVCPPASINHDSEESDELLTDPMTGETETLSCGQNKQGFGELSVVNSGLDGPKARPKVQLAGSQLAGGLQSGTGIPKVELGQNVTDQVLVDSSATGRSPASVMVFDGPQSKSRLIGYADVGAVDAHDGGHLRFHWQPRTLGRHLLHEILLESDGTTTEQTQAVDVVAAPSAITKIVLTPGTARVAAGSWQAYRATAFGAGNRRLGEVTNQMTFEMAGGTCAANRCRASTIGMHLVTAHRGTLTTHAYLLVVRRNPALRLTPSTATVRRNQIISYRAWTTDSRGKAVDVTTAATFSINGGSCSRGRCRAPSPGRHTVTGAYHGISATATLTVR